MAYLKPPALTRHVANPLAMRHGGRGVAPPTATARRTGQPRRVPVIETLRSSASAKWDDARMAPSLTAGLAAGSPCRGVVNPRWRKGTSFTGGESRDGTYRG